jgi:sugar lactone lactonase YvrE
MTRNITMFFRIIVAALMFGILPMAGQAAEIGKPRLEIVAQLKQRPGNIAVADDGRMFISVHPFDNPIDKVLELLPDGTTKPYPNDIWSKEPGPDGNGFANVIHLLAVGKLLYILDMGGPRVQPKLVVWNITDNKLERIWYLPNHVNTPQSFDQDFVLTPDQKWAFIADMGQVDLAAKAEPAIIVLNLETGAARRVLGTHASVRPAAKPMVAAGEQMKLTREGKELPLYLGLNPITIDPKGEWLYYSTMGQGLLYRILVHDLIDSALTPEALAQRVAVVGTKPPSDGMLIDGLQNIFITSVADGSIGIMNNQGRYSTWLRDPLLSWPDGLAFGPEGAIYVTVNQLHLASMFNKGEDKSTPPYMVLRILGGRPIEEKKN